MMRRTVFFLSISWLGYLQAPEVETFTLNYPVSKQETIVYKRVIQFDKKKNIFVVRDYFEDGQIQMEASYSSFDLRIKEQYQCNHRSNTKESTYREWYRNGQKKFVGNFRRGLLNGLGREWYPNGLKETEANWRSGQLHGRVRYWSERGDLQFDSTFRQGVNQHPKDAHYPSIATRYEYYTYHHGFTTGTPGHIQEVTGTLEHPIATHILARLEYRRDVANNPIFLKGTSLRVREQNTLAAGMVFAFDSRGEAK